MIKRLLQQINQSRKLLAISIMFGCFGGLVLIAEAYYIASIVDDVFMQGFGFAEVKLLIAILLGIIIFRGMIQVISEYMASKLAQQIKGELRLRLIGKLGKLGPQYNKTEKSGELASTVYEGVEQLENYLAKYVPQIALSMFIPFAVFVVVLRFDLFSAIVYGVTLPLLIVFMILIGKYTKHRTDKQYKLLGRLGGHFQEILRGMETLKMFNRSKDQYDNIAKISEEHRKSTMATLRLAFLSAFVMELFSTISTAIVAVFLGLRLIEGEMQFYDAFLILLLTPEFYAPIRALGTQFHSGMNGASAATRIFEILDTKEQGVVEQAQAVKWSEACQEEQGVKINFNAVSVCYEGYDKPALDHINFEIKPGQKLAIVGSTGAGKSTILDIVQGFLTPSAGQVYINDIALNKLSIDDWRKQIAVVSQQSYLFHGTIRENLVGNDNENMTDAHIWQALKWAGAEDFIRALPEGIDTVLSDQIQLSGGQIKRLALTRAYLRKDVKLVLLDEATTSLDIYHERIINAHLKHYLQHKTSIIVTHQLDWIEDADYVLVLKEGRIVESGNPDELANENGLFSKMLKANSWRENDSQAKQDIAVDFVSGEQSSIYINESQKNHEQNKLSRQEQLFKSQLFDKQSSLSFIQLLFAYKKLLTFFSKHKFQVALALLLSFLTIAANIGLMGTSGYLIAKSALRPENILMVYIPVVGVRFFGISRGVFRYLERLASHNVTFKTLHDMRLWLYKKIEPRGMTLLKDNRGGQILGTVISDIEQLQFFFLRLFSPFFVYLLIVVGSIVGMAFIHPRLSLVLLCMLLIAGLLIPYRNYAMSKRNSTKMVNLRIKLYEQTLDMLRGVGTLQQNGWYKHSEQQFAHTQRQLSAIQLKEHFHTAYHNGLMTISTHLGMWLLLVISIPLIRDGSVAPYMLPAILMMTLACFEGAAPMPQAFQASVPVAKSAYHLFQLAEQSNEQAGSEDESGQKQAVQSNQNSATQQAATWSCKLEAVGFKYEDSEALALKDIHLSLSTGKKVAIVGESGAGKSTLIQALLKLRPITTGSYMINDENVIKMDEAKVREHFSVVSQHVQLFNATVLDNLRLGKKLASLDEVRTAAKLAEIDDFIMNLPHGYYTMIGEYGATLSGGQRQRFALARALIQGHAALLFDEPSTGLDRLTEQAFLKNIRHIERQHAVLWITHRLQQVVEMDEIIVLNKGQMVERGTHEQLLALKGLYWRMWCLERAQDWQSVV